MPKSPDYDDIGKARGPDAVREAFDNDPIEPPPAPPLNGHAASPLPPCLPEDDFLSRFHPPDYLIDGLLQRRFLYSMTGQTGHAKTAIALRLARLVGQKRGSRYIAGHEVEPGRVPGSTS